ncbi:Arc family DNA-binding protein [Pseudomonas sp.]|uniref:Arc family DNA-binding protein n=1 Tax=Pseudomonas sp. TaxID=306 RepID=UPI0027367E05|nr:Arc family DNA-binding protein [Pseudomonas sp.]MDP2746196.1 Arc family DNA-binding protein [Pseudomonas sp.]
MSRTDPQFNLRIPEELRDKVAEAAKENRRSATAEIIARLEASFQQAFTFADAVIVDEVHRTEPKFSEADIKTAIDQVFGKLLFERIGLTATPTEEQPLPLDQAVKHNPHMKIPTSVKRVKQVKRSRPLGVDPKP